MTIKKRRIFYLALFLVFIILAPIIVLYATGYNFNIGQKKFTKTGFLALDSYPQNADIYIDNTITKEKTPEKFRYLSPRLYNIKIKKSGYTDWSKNLKILPNLSTFAEKIVLFLKKPLAENLLEENITQYKVSPNGEKIALVIKKNDYQVLVIDLKNKNKKVIKKSIKSPITQIEWIDNFLFLAGKNEEKNEYQIISTIYSEEINLSEISDKEFTKIEPYKDNFYTLSENILYKIDLSNKKLTRVSEKQVSDFTVKNNIYYIGKNNQEKNLYRLENDEDKIIDNLNYKLNYRFISLKNNNFILASENNFFLYKDENIRINFNQKITKAEISPDSKKLMYYNSHEIWLYDWEKEENHLITRISEEIKNSFWYPRHHYIVYEAANTIKATEVDLRDKRNQITLYAASENIDFISLVSEKYLSLITKKEPLSVLKLLKIQK
ncbi:MAG: PEGA domain-containing protein [Patescibacteria group bacterium]|nr:PEGA domain-containing protein [Patescibacteria group bacterium]